MGCCFSSSGKERNAVKAQYHHHSPVKPRPSLEEETVKEVLSETPLPPKPHHPEKNPEIITPEPEEEKLAEALPKIVAISCEPPEEEEDGAAREEASEYSEIYSASESLSTATTNTTVAEKRDDDITSRIRDGREFAGVEQRVRRSSPVRAPRNIRYTGGDGKRRMSKSPAPRSVPTDSRRLPPTRTQVAAARTARTTARHCAGGLGLGKGRDLGGGYNNRSRSPARGRDGGIGRIPAKKVESGGGVRWVDSAGSGAGNGKDLREENGENVAVAVAVAAEERNDDVLKPVNDCVDNPLVSLECFIFL